MAALLDIFISLMKTWKGQVPCENYESSETDPVMIADNFSDKGNVWTVELYLITTITPQPSCPSSEINPQTNYNQLLAMTISSVFSISHFNSAVTETPQMPESWQNSH